MNNKYVIFYMLLFTIPTYSDIGAFVENNNIDETQTIRLVVQTTNPMAEEPDWSDIERVFEIVGKSSNTRISTVNGRITSIAAWTLNLRPPGIGTFLIPSIAVSDELTSPIEIIVRPLPDEIKNEISSAVYFEREIDREWVYVQSQLVVTQRILISSIGQLINELPTLDLPNAAIVTTIGDVEQYDTTRGGERYSVYEQRFAVFPERSGALKIASTDVLVSVRLLNNRRRIPVSIPSQELVVEVRPKPSSYPQGHAWLPATRVILSENGSTTPLTQPGDSTTRIITIEAYGLTAAAIPPFEFNVSNNLRGYEDPPELIDRIRNKQVLGIRRQSQTLVATSSGPSQITASTLYWWNVNKDQLEQAILPPQYFEIQGTTNETRENKRITDSFEDVSERQQYSPETRPTEYPPTRFILILIVAIGVMGWVLALYLFRSYKLKPNGKQSNSNQVTKSKNLQAIKTKLRQSTRPQEMKSLMFSWIQENFGINRGEAIELLVSHHTGRNLLSLMNSNEYSTDKLKDAQILSPYSCIQIIEEMEASVDNNKSALPPLY